MESLDEDLMFDLCANKSLREIKAMEANSEIQLQAIRYYFSRLLMEHTESNPLNTDYLGRPLDILVDTDDLQKQHIIALCQAECEGIIYVMLYGSPQWFNIDMLSCQEQLELLDELCKVY